MFLTCCYRCGRSVLPRRFPHLFPSAVLSTRCMPTQTSFQGLKLQGVRGFHDYFVTHLPSSSLHPDRPNVASKAKKKPGSQDEAQPSQLAHSDTSLDPEELTIIRIPLRSAKHHFGASSVRGSRPTNEDAYQAGVLDIPAFAKRPPISLNETTKAAWLSGDGMSADGASGDPQVFYFAVFDGHGGDVCSHFLRDELHNYIETASRKLALGSTLEASPLRGIPKDPQGNFHIGPVVSARAAGGEEQKEKKTKITKRICQAHELERKLVEGWRDLVGGYFRRFKPQFFPRAGGGQGQVLTCQGAEDGEASAGSSTSSNSVQNKLDSTTIESVLEYAFLEADYDFISAQAAKRDPNDSTAADRALNEGDILDMPSRLKNRPIGQGDKRFLGGSTCSAVLISTPSAKPFWNPSASCTLICAHAGDTRIILCNTLTGKAVAVTRNHHPSLPSEEARLRRYSASFMTDSFGEQRIIGLANTRSFGDMPAKRVGVSAEPELARIEVGPAEYSFVVLVSDGVSGVVSDQEVVDIVKEAKTADEGARSLASFAEEVGGSEGDNATALVVRLGGWERRSEGGVGSLATKEKREMKLREAMDPRRDRQ